MSTRSAGRGTLPWFFHAQVGVLRSHPPRLDFGGLAAVVDDLFVRAPYRCAGPTTAALAFLRTFRSRRGSRTTLLETGRDNAAAQALYRRVGFTPTDRLLPALKLALPTHEE